MLVTIVSQHGRTLPILRLLAIISGTLVVTSTSGSLIPAWGSVERAISWFRECLTVLPRNRKTVMAKCQDCKDTGRIKLFTSEVDCNCQQQVTSRSCENCSDPCYECDGTCDEGCGSSCYRCSVWVGECCLIEGMCTCCFQKLQGGVV